MPLSPSTGYFHLGATSIYEHPLSSTIPQDNMQIWLAWGKHDKHLYQFQSQVTEQCKVVYTRSKSIDE